jgi:3'(2'), 5'-bisphosphate nucleotidase
VDVCLRSGPAGELDVAAGQAIFEAAAAAVNQSHTEGPLRYNKKNLLNPPFVCVSSQPYGEIHRGRG